jgi:hypothetical protein
MSSAHPHAMGQSKRLLLACLCTLAMQPVLSVGLLYLWDGDKFPLVELLMLSPIILFIAGAHLLFLGLPTLWALHRAARVTALNMALAGFFIGSLGVALLLWPVDQGGGSFSATWHGEFRELRVNGRPTLFGWLHYLEVVSLFGTHGLVSALVFHSVWRRRQTT